MPDLFPPDPPPTAVLGNLRQAERLYPLCQEEVASDPELKKRLEDYQKAIIRSRQQMEQCGMVQYCAACAQNVFGGCCFQEAENWYDPVLLNINLLLKSSLPREREVPGHCLFLGVQGCRLEARYFFCVNYVCPYLEQILPPLALQEVRRAWGTELAVGSALEAELRRRLARKGRDPASTRPLTEKKTRLTLRMKTGKVSLVSGGPWNGFVFHRNHRSDLKPLRPGRASFCSCPQRIRW